MTVRLFNTLALEITADCNRRCVFCPVSYNPRTKERMDSDLLNKAIEELSEIDYSGRVELYIYNEPVKDKEYLLEAIVRIRKEVPRCCIMIATNGDYFKRGENDIEELYNAGLNQLLINCYSKGLYEKRLPWIERLPASISRTKSVYAVSSPKTKTVQILDKSENHSFGTGVFRMVNRAGNIEPFMKALDKPVSRMCVKPFRLLNINWKGEALICCQDYYGDVNVGNLKDLSLKKLWNSPVLNTYRKYLSEKNRSLPLCNKCDCHSGAYPHMVDLNIGPMAPVDTIVRKYRRTVKDRNIV